VIKIILSRREKGYKQLEKIEEITEIIKVVYRRTDSNIAWLKTDKQ